MLADFLRFLTGQPPKMDQSECEAFVDAVVYTMLADKVIDPDEMEAVEEFAEKLPWKSFDSVHNHVRNSLGRAAKNQNFMKQAEPYLAGIAARLKTSESRRYTRDACLKIVKADGEQSRTELALVELANRAFA